MYIITVKNTSTSTSYYCKSAWTTSIGFTNSLLELLLKYLFGVDDYFVYLQSEKAS